MHWGAIWWISLILTNTLLSSSTSQVESFSKIYQRCILLIPAKVMSRSQRDNLVRSKAAQSGFFVSLYLDAQKPSQQA